MTTSMYTSRGGRGSRPDLSFLGIGGGLDRDVPTVETRRETKAERESRKLEKERAAREKERERSVREEGVDGGYLVTLGTYTGPEDFNKVVVRQLMIERRLAPFWKGLNDHSDSWTEHQLVAAVNGLPIPPADEILPEEPPRGNNLSADWNPRSSNSNINSLTFPIISRSPSSNSDKSTNLSPSHPAFSLPSLTSPSPSSSPFFRGRAKTLAALTTSSRNNSQTEMTPQEIQLPKDPYVHGQRIEAFLYKNASECPICFLYYPPYLNKTRCCDQPICSECFVQIKRPDPHPPEHHDPSDPNASNEPPEDNMLVSEPAACPFCVQPEFGVTYESPPFRKGLSYANQGNHPLATATSAMSSSSSLASQGLGSPAPTSRRRTTSISANSSNVITTDKVRPDWAKKLSDARAHALRRAAAATALHNAAYMMGNLQASEGTRGFALGRRRRTMFGGDSPGSSGHGTPRHGDSVSLGNVGALLAAAERAGQSGNRPTEGQSDLFPGRHSSRRNRLEDLEDLMMMEAIRLSLAAEEERKKKEEKEAAKEAKKEEKKKAKEAKKAEKAARKSGYMHSGTYDPDSDSLAAGSSSTVAGKGKGVDRSARYASFNSLNEPTSTLGASSSKEDPQRHLEQSRAQIQSQSPSTNHTPSPFDPLAESGPHRSMLRHLSNASSSASSFAESIPGSLHQGSTGGFGASASSFELNPNNSGLSISRSDTPPGGTPGTEPMFNFRSLAAVIGNEEEQKDSGNDILHIGYLTDKDRHSSESSSNQNRSRGDSGESSSSAPPPSLRLPAYAEKTNGMDESVATMRPPKLTNSDEMESAPPLQIVSTNASNPYDAKHYGDVSVLDSFGQQTTQ